MILFDSRSDGTRLLESRVLNRSVEDESKGKIPDMLFREA